jgi:autotransporter-associated beta strand protein
MAARSPRKSAARVGQTGKWIPFSRTPPRNSGALGIDTTGGDFTLTTTNLGTTLGLSKLGPNTLILDQTNIYTGNTTVSAGTLRLENTGAVAGSPLVAIGGNGLEIATDTAFSGPNISMQAGTIVSDRASDGDGLTHALGNATIGNGASNFIAGSNVTGGTAAIQLGNISNNNGIVNLTNTETVAAPDFDGTPQPSGNYSATSVPGGATITTASFSGSGTLTIGPPTGGFSSWITGTFANGAVTNQGSNDDDDNDGISNLVEYAIAGQDPTVPNPTIGTLTGGTLSFTKRGDASGLTYAIQESTDLGIGDDWDEVTGGSYVNDGSTISYTLTPGTPAKNFLRLRVSQ